MTSTKALERVVKVVSLVVFTLAMSACQNNQGASSSTRTPTPVKPAIAPGSVQLTVTIGDCNARENNVKSAIFDCEATVQSVQEYGAGTTQLPESTPIRISFRASLLAENADSILQSGNELSLVIQSTRNTNETNTDPIWDTVLIIE